MRYVSDALGEKDRTRGKKRRREHINEFFWWTCQVTTNDKKLVSDSSGWRKRVRMDGPWCGGKRSIRNLNLNKCQLVPPITFIPCSSTFIKIIPKAFCINLSAKFVFRNLCPKCSLHSFSEVNEIKAKVG